MPEYLYYDKDKVVNKQYNAALSLLNTYKLTVDAVHLPLFENASEGDMEAVCELAQAFHEGNIKGIPKNYEMARFYINIVTSTVTNDKEAVLCLTQSARMEFNFGNKERAKKEFLEAAKIQTEKIDPKEWDYNVYEWLKELMIVEVEKSEIK